jgi:glucokinase
MKNYVIGVDVGGTQLRTILLDDTGHVYARTSVPTNREGGPSAVIEQILAGVGHVQTSLPVGADLLGIGIGAPGPLDPETGIVMHTPNMPGWKNVPLRDIIAQQTGLKVELGNDANAAALGEWHFGGGIGHRHLIYITVSTGIGAGVIVDGRLLLGRQGAGAELGHVLIDTAGDNHASWEEMASGTALRAAAVGAMEDDPDTLLHTLATSEHITGAHVAEAARRGDSVAERLMQREARLLGIGFVNALHLFSPEIILVGGSVVTRNPGLLAAAQQFVNRRVIADLYREVPIEVAHLGDEVGLFGAAALILYDQKARSSWPEMSPGNLLENR